MRSRVSLNAVRCSVLILLGAPPVAAQDAAPKMWPCDPAVYTGAGRHMPTPAFDESQIRVSSAVIAYLNTLCMMPGKGHERHPMFRKNETLFVDGAAFPEFGAMNILRSDLAKGGRVIAQVVMSTTIGPAVGFPYRHYKEGANYIYLGKTAVGATPRAWIFYPDGSTYELGSTEYVISDHGHDPETGWVVPGFNSLTYCQQQERRACLLDSKGTVSVTPTLRTLAKAFASSRSAPDTAIQRQAMVALLASEDISEGTGTWVKLNGLCFCQGNDCH